MGFSAGSEGKGGRFLGSGGGLTEINVTPFVDVVLVLLIIFMVTAPFAISGVNVDLPKNNTDSIGAIKNPTVLSVTGQGEFYFGDEKVNADKLIPTLKRLRDIQKADSGNTNSLYIRADRKVPYGTVMVAMEAAKKAGFVKIGMMGKAAK